MIFPSIPEALRLERLRPPKGRVRMVLDTDTYNEIDDQFAVIYALLSPEHLSVEAIYAAPFFNERSSGPGDGMEKSYEEILRLLARLDVPSRGFVFPGSTGFLTGAEGPYRSEAALDLIERAMASGDEPLYVAAIGALTNVASAILIEPAIIERIVVVWLGGQPHHWSSASEFNLSGDLEASRTIFDCGVPLVQIPCYSVASHLLTTAPELERYVRGQGAIGDYLFEIFEEYTSRWGSLSKEIWDISTLAYLIDADWTPSQIVHSPILTGQVTWSFDNNRHFMRSVNFVKRDPIFNDLFSKIQARAEDEGR